MEYNDGEDECDDEYFHGEAILSLFLSEHHPCEIMGIRAGECLLPLAADADCQGERLALVATEADVCVWSHSKRIIGWFLNAVASE